MCWGRIHGLAAVTPEGKCAVLRLGDFSLARGPQAAEAGGLGHRPTAWALSCLLLLIPLPHSLGPTVPLTAEKSTGSSQHLSTVTHSSQRDGSSSRLHQVTPLPWSQPTQDPHRT